MANKDPSKTEAPTKKRIDKAREEGNVMTSPDIMSMLMICAGCMLMLVLGPDIRDGFGEIFSRIFKIDCREDWTNADLSSGGTFSIVFIGKVMAPTLIIICILAMFFMRFQVGKYFSIKTLKWKFDFANPKKGLMSLAPNKQNFVKLGLTLAKVILIGGLVYASMSSQMDALRQLPTIPLQEAISWMVWESFFLTLKIMVLFIFIAVADYIFKRKKYFDDLKMSKQEVKDERKNAEGDMMMKGKIRQRMRELMRSQVMRNVPDADVILTNPTHVAVAIKYEIGGFAPMVVAKGLRKRAERIKLIARQYKIPIVESPPLARSLYRNTKVNNYIQVEFYTPVAAILAQLHRSGKRKFRHYKKPKT
ncbi:MAG: EscU/YscU/HrcU family type III secretion system export apparatus switch protein [Victivallales bacterium]|nr:EscU/YscU/HrcU family type III secretion system export apparatus switch protein [Victivallales bacterium]